MSKILLFSLDGSTEMIGTVKFENENEYVFEKFVLINKFMDENQQLKVNMLESFYLSISDPEVLHVRKDKIVWYVEEEDMKNKELIEKYKEVVSPIKKASILDLNNFNKNNL